MKKVVSHVAGHTLQARADGTIRVKEGFDWSRIYDPKNPDDIMVMAEKYPALMKHFSLLGFQNMPKVTIGNESITDMCGHPLRSVDGMYRTDDLAAMLGVPLEEIEELAIRLQNGEQL